MELTLFQEGGLIALAWEHRPGARERAVRTCDPKNKGPACN